MKLPTSISPLLPLSCYEQMFSSAPCSRTPSAYVCLKTLSVRKYCNIPPRKGLTSAAEVIWTKLHIFDAYRVTLFRNAAIDKNICGPTFSTELRYSGCNACHVGRGQLKRNGTRAETRFRLSAKRTSPFKSAGGRQFSRLPAAEVCASAVVMLDTPCSEVV